MIGCLSAPDPVVPGSTELVRVAITAVTETPLAANRNTFEIVACRSAWLSTQRPHDGLPLCTVRPDVTQTVQPVRDVMRHFVWHGGTQVVVEVLGKQIRVITNEALATPRPVHACRPAAQIETDGNRLEIQLK